MPKLVNRADMRLMPIPRNQKTSLCLLISSVVVALALAGALHNAVAGDEAQDDGFYYTTVSRPPGDGFWYKIIVHNCLPQTAVTMHYVIDDSSGAPYRDEREKFERTKNSYQSAWLPMEKGSFSVEKIEFLDNKGKVVLAFPRSGTIKLPVQFELTEKIPASAIAIPAQEEYGQCKIVR